MGQSAFWNRSGAWALALVLAPGGPDPLDVESLMKGSTKALPGTSIPASTFGGRPLPLYRSGEAASEAVESALAAARPLLSVVKRQQQDLAHLKGLAEKAAAETSALVDGKGAYLEEIRQGLFCSGCGKTRSVILASGDSFPHPGQHILRPTPEQLAERERDYEGRIASARQRQAGLERQVQSTREGLEREGQALVYQLALLFNGLRQEAPLLLKAFRVVRCGGGLPPKDREQTLAREGVAYNRKRARLFGQISKGNGLYAEAAALRGPGALPPWGLPSQVTGLPDADHVSCD